MGSIQGPSNNQPARKPGEAAPAAHKNEIPAEGKPAGKPEGKPESKKAPENKDEANYAKYNKADLKKDASGGMTEAMDKKAAAMANTEKGKKLLAALSHPDVAARIDAALKNPDRDYEDISEIIIDEVRKLESPDGPVFPGTADEFDSKFNGSDGKTKAVYRETLNRWVNENYRSKDSAKLTPEQKADKLKNFFNLLAGGPFHICENGPVC